MRPVYRQPVAVAATAATAKLAHSKKLSDRHFAASSVHRG